MSDNSFFAELKKRKVVQVAAIYGAVAWGVTEIVVTVVDQLFLPRWVSTLAVIAFVVGFPIAMFLAWTFDITPDGIQRTTVTSRRGKASIAGAISLLVVFTTGLFLLIRPTIQDRAVEEGSLVALANSIAVLPFDNASRDPDDDYLSEGLSDELRDQLGRVSGLRIAARSSSIAAQQQVSDAMTRSGRLGVAVLVEGSVRRRGNNLRISVQLIEGRSGLSLWSETYDRSPQELLTAQQDIANQIVHQMLPDSQEVIATASTQSASANELILLARYYEQQVREQPEVDFDTLSKAIDLYRQAAEADPDSALAHSKLASALMYAGDILGAEAPIFRALTLNPELSEVQNTLGEYYMTRSLPGAGNAYRRAVELNSNNADALADYAWWVWMQGHNDEPTALFQRALELDPLSLSRFGDLGNYYGQEGRVDDTLEIIRRVDDMFDSAASYRLIARLLELSGRLDQGIAWAIRARDKEPGNPANTGMLAELYAEIGDFNTALMLEPEPGPGLLFKMRQYQEVIDTGEFLMIEEPNDIYLRYLLAFSYNATEQHTKAIYVLRSTGLPDSVVPEAKQATDIEAFVYLFDALEGVGEADTAREMANWFLTGRSHVVNDNWWVNLYTGCALAVLGRDGETMDRFDIAAESARLPWDNIARDSRCFRQFADEPRYKAMLQRTDERKAALRERLPATLVEFGVSL